MKVLECSQLFEGCPARVEADTEEEILEIAAEHARETHGLESVDNEVATKLRAAIRTA